jgi:hypothetical protein
LYCHLWLVWLYHAFQQYLNNGKNFEIGLQAKGLSGAQRKRFVRERKMREGTWTEKKPPRNLHLWIRVRWGIVEV